MTNGPPDRGECVWMARATSSLPVPLSPSTRIVDFEGPGQADELEDLPHALGLADDAAEAEAARQLLLQPPVLLGQAARLRALLDGQEDFLVLERLRDVVERAVAHRLDRALDRGVRGDDHDHGVGIPPADVAQNLEAGAVGQHQVEEHDVVRLRLERGESAGAVRSGRHLPPFPLEERREDVADDLLVVDDENAERPRHEDPARDGQRDPRLGSAAARGQADLAAVAPHDLARDRETEARAARLLRRVEGLEEPLVGAGGEPRAAVRDDDADRPALFGRARSDPRRLSGEASRAFVKRLTKTCSSSRGSPSTQTGVPPLKSTARRLVPSVVSTDSAALATTRRRSVRTRAAARGRANSRRLLTRCAARKVCRSIFFRIAYRGSPGAVSARSICA